MAGLTKKNITVWKGLTKNLWEDTNIPQEYDIATFINDQYDSFFHDFEDLYTETSFCGGCVLDGSRIRQILQFVHAIRDAKLGCGLPALLQIELNGDIIFMWTGSVHEVYLRFTSDGVYFNAGNRISTDIYQSKQLITYHNTDFFVKEMKNITTIDNVICNYIGTKFTASHLRNRNRHKSRIANF